MVSLIPEFIFTFTSVTALVLLAYSVEQLADTYTQTVATRQQYLNQLDEMAGY